MPRETGTGRRVAWAAALLLFGFALGLWASEGMRALRRGGAHGPVTQLVCAPPGLDLGLGTPPVLDAGAARVADATSPPDGGPRDGGVLAGTGTRALWVDVLDAKGQPAAGASVSARLVFVPGVAGDPAAPGGSARPSPSTPVGELGVLRGTLPFPEDVIAGRSGGGMQLERGASGSDLAVSAAAQTDAAGVAKLMGVPVGRVQVTASRDGLSATGEIRVPPAPAPDSITAGEGVHLVLRLAALTEATCAIAADDGDVPVQTAPAPPGSESGIEVAGQVVDGRGFPVSGARIEATVGRSRGEQLTDARGRFTLRGLPAGTGSVQVRHPGFAPLTSKLVPEARTELRLVLQAGGGVSGTLRDRRLGELPTGAELVLEVRGDGGTQRIPLSLGSGGRFSASGLPTGEATLRARAPGFAPLFQSVQITPAGSPGEVSVRDLRLELEQGARLSGQVRSESGSGVVASIEVTDARGRTVARGASQKSGDFELSDLPAGPLDVRAQGGTATARSRIELRAGADERLDLELR